MLTHGWGWRELLLPQAFRGFAQQFCVAPIVTLTLGALPPERLKSASGLFNLMRNLGGAIGIVACGTILNDRTNLHFLRIAEHLTAANEAMQGALNDLTLRYGQALADPLQGQAAALKSLWLLAYREAQVETFADAYLAIAACFALAVCMVPLTPKVAPPQAPSPRRIEDDRATPKLLVRTAFARPAQQDHGSHRGPDGETDDQNNGFSAAHALPQRTEETVFNASVNCRYRLRVNISEDISVHV
jgi:DHA2 family multidrug resistance protein